MARMLAGDDLRAEKWQINRKDGMHRVMTISTSRVTTEGGVQAYLCLVDDVTDSHELEATLRASEERLKMALAASRMGVWEWDLQTDRVYWSPECFHLLDPVTFDGTLKSFTNQLHPEDAPRVMAAIEQARGRRYDVLTRHYHVRTALCISFTSACVFAIAGIASATLIGDSIEYDGHVKKAATTGIEKHFVAPAFPPSDFALPVTNGPLASPLSPARDLTGTATEFIDASMVS